jgi:hypothetical protein
VSDAPQTVTIGEKQYAVSELSNEVKELLSLHAQAQEMMIGARRQAVIHEVSVVNLANMIKSRVEAQADAEHKPDPPLAGHVVQ